MDPTLWGFAPNQDDRAHSEMATWHHLVGPLTGRLITNFWYDFGQVTKKCVLVLENKKIVFIKYYYIFFYSLFTMGLTLGD